MSAQKNIYSVGYTNHSMPECVRMCPRQAQKTNQQAPRVFGGMKGRTPGSRSRPLPVGCAPSSPRARAAPGDGWGLEGTQQKPSLPWIRFPFSRALGPEFQEGGLSKESGKKAMGRVLCPLVVSGWGQGWG